MKLFLWCGSTTPAKADNCIYMLVRAHTWRGILIEIICYYTIPLMTQYLAKNLIIQT